MATTLSRVEKVIHRFAPYCARLTITEQTHFENDLGFDSLEKLEFSMDLEAEFGVSFDDYDTSLNFVGELVKIIDKKLLEQGN